VTDRHSPVYKKGDMVGSDYCLLEKIGEGGMGIVFRAKHMVMDSTSALKILRPDQITTATWMRFQAEVKALSKLNHPNIVQIFNMGVDRERVPFYVMELLSGQPLSDEIAGHGAFGLKRMAEIFIPVCSALAFSHRHGIIHRDIKPSNVMLVGAAQNTTSIKLVDFGIAKSQHLAGYEGQSLTTTGEIFGTPYYLSPECISGGPADARSDIYSLGCAIFETLVGAPPFRGQSMLHTLMMHQNEPAPSLKSVNPNGQYPRELEIFVATLLAKNPDDRFQDAAAIEERLRQLCAQDFPENTGVSGIGFNSTILPNEQAEQFATTTVVTKAPSNWRRNAAFAGILMLAGTGGILATNHYFDAKPKQNPKKEEEIAVHPILDTMKNFDSDADEDIKHFSLGLRGKGNSAQYWYHFPSRRLMGQIWIDSGKEYNAQGDVRIPATDRLGFRFNHNTAETSALTKLNCDEFTDLRISPQDPSLEQLVSILSKWTKLRHLQIELLCESEKDFERLSRLKKIDELILTSSVVPAHCLANPKLFENVKSLTLDRIKTAETNSTNIDEMLSNVGQRRNLTTLNIEYQRLTHKLVSDISQSTTIKSLKMTSGDETNVLYDQDIQLLSTMPALESLTIANAHLSPRSIEYFKKGFKRLKVLRLPTQIWADADKNKMAALFASRSCEFVAPAKPISKSDRF